MGVLMYFALAVGFTVSLGFAALTGIVFTLLIECFKKGDTTEFKLAVTGTLVMCTAMTVAAVIMMIQVCRNIIW